MSYFQTKMPISPALLPTSRWGRVSLGQGGHLARGARGKRNPPKAIGGSLPLHLSC